MPDEVSPQNQIMILDPKLIHSDAVLIETSQNGEEVILTIASGGVAVNRYAFSPKHAKRLMLLLERKLAEYETQFGTLTTELPLETLSPNSEHPAEVTHQNVD